MDNIYVLPSIFALAFKLVVFVRGRPALAGANPFLLGAIGSLFLANAIEFSGFAYFNQHPNIARIPLCGYYFSITSFAFSMLCLALSGIGRLNKLALWGIALVWASLSTLLFSPDLVIAGVQSINYSITRIKGPLYVLAPLGFLLPNLIASGILIYGIITRRGEQRRLLANNLLAVLCILITELAVAALMAKGAKVNMTMCLSFMSIASVWLLIASDNKLAFTLLASIQGDERTFIRLTYAAYNDTPQLDDATTTFKLALIEKTLNNCDGDLDKAAKILGKSTSTLRRIIKERRTAPSTITPSNNPEEQP